MRLATNVPNLEVQPAGPDEDGDVDDEEEQRLNVRRDARPARVHVNLGHPLR